MTNKLLSSTLTCIIIVCTSAIPAFGISLRCSSGDGGEAASTSESYNLDDSTSLKENLILGSGSIVIDRQAAGTGKNRLMQSLSGTAYTLQNDIDSQGRLRSSTSSSASTEAASLGQNVDGVGFMSLNLQGAQGASSAGQEASVAGGSLASAQSLSAGQGQGALAAQSTAMDGQKGKVVSGALGEKNVMLAESGFSGQGSMAANLASKGSESASSSGSAAIDDVVILDDGSFKAVSTESKNRVMGMAGMRLADDGQGIGSFDMGVMNLDRSPENGAAQVSQTAAAASGGSYSSYSLTGFRLNQKDPKLQLYLNPTDTPSGLTPESSQSAIANAANTWDDAVAQNIFADGTPVIIDYSKVVDNPFPAAGQEKSDGYSVNGWKNFGNGYLGLTRFWSDGQMVNGYYSLTESDTWYNRDYQWTTDLATAQSTGRVDLQSVAVHELGHSIGMDDIYSTSLGGHLPPSDPRTQDYAQVMNCYDAPQRTLGDGDRTGAQALYGTLLPVSRTIAFRVYNGQFVCAEGGGGQALVANRDWTRQWETFNLIDLGNNKVALQAYNGQFVCAEGGGGQALVANRDWARQWETFNLIDLGNNKVALQAYNGQFVCAEGGGGQALVANRDWIREWETFAS